jgi:enoyl-CoA hydratase/carnithine racemase
MSQGTPATAPVLLESEHGGVALLVLNRPERMNALNNELTAHWKESPKTIRSERLS